MRFTTFVVFGLALSAAGCRWVPFTSKSSPADRPTPKVKAAPDEDFGTYPSDFQQRVVTAFQAKWPNDPIYNYRFELPRRVKISYAGSHGYAVRFRAQKPTLPTPLAEGYPWVAFFAYGKIVWVQRDSEVVDNITWYDPPQATIDWSPAAPAQ